MGLLTIFRGTDGLQLGGLVALSTVTSFGGGEAYIGVADGFFVRPGLVGTEEFFTGLVPIANALPGPILIKVAGGVGYIFGSGMGQSVAWLLGLAAALIAMSVSCAVALPILAAYDWLQHHPLMVNIGTYILPVICGLLIQVCATMLEVSATVAASAGIPSTPLIWVMLVVVVILTVAHLHRLVPDTLMLTVCGLASLVMLSL
jgi:chromate transporter